MKKIKFKIKNFLKAYCLQLNAINNDNRGATAILTVVIIGAAALIMAVAASYLGLGELDMGYVSQKGGETFAVADGCAEEALRHLRINTSYTGDTLSLGGGSCIISISTAGADRTITVTSTIGDFNKSLEINLTLSGDVITINSWSEI